MVSHFPGLAQPLQRNLQKQQFPYRYVATIEHIIQANILYSFLLLRASRRRRKYQNVMSLFSSTKVTMLSITPPRRSVISG